MQKAATVSHQEYSAEVTRRSRLPLSAHHLTRHYRKKLEPFTRACFWCGEPLGEGDDTLVTHWYPQPMGGPTKLWNLRLVHRRCFVENYGTASPEATTAFKRWADANGYESPPRPAQDERLEAVLPKVWPKGKKRRRNRRLDREREKARKFRGKLEERDKSCYWCKQSFQPTEDTTVDHWYPVSRDGPTELWNLRLMHPICNVEKGDQILPEAEAAYRAWRTERTISGDTTE